MTRVNTNQKRRVRQSLSGLFKGALNRLLEEMIPRTYEHDEWVALLRKQMGAPNT
jgi:hypothetical protein